MWIKFAGNSKIDCLGEPTYHWSEYIISLINNKWH